MQEEEVHIVMSDQRMPQITGVELLTKVKARHPQAIRMLFTGFADLESIIAAINQGHIYQFMKKPWQPEELLAAVRQAAVEFDRLEAMAHGARAPCGRSHRAQERVSALETEVQRLQHIHSGRFAGRRRLRRDKLSGSPMNDESARGMFRETSVSDGIADRASRDERSVAGRGSDRAAGSQRDGAKAAYSPGRR